jgi:hypothetical protein
VVSMYVVVDQVRRCVDAPPRSPKTRISALPNSNLSAFFLEAKTVLGVAHKSHWQIPLI